MQLQIIQQAPSLESGDVRWVRTTIEDGLRRDLVVLQTPYSHRRVAALIRPAGREVARPAILFVHWYEPDSPDSDRSEFEAEAKRLAQDGAICLTVETLWSDRDFFIKRTQRDDLRSSIEEAVNLRRWLDFLLTQPGVDPERLALVGHDFGAMYAILAGHVDRRPSHYVVMAATPRFSDWYLYSPKLEGEAREDFVRQMAEIDPVTHVGSLSPAPILFQFGTDDPHVSRDRAEDFHSAARPPKECTWYQAGHALNEEAREYRREWLRHGLRLS
jgi:dienelactone hydrolase